MARMNSSACAPTAAFSIRVPARAGRLAIGNVGGYGVIEQGDFLAHQCDVPAQAGQGKRFDVVAVDPDATRTGMVEARYQVRERGLAATGRADKGDGFAGTDRQCDILQCRHISPGVTEADTVESYVSARALQLCLPSSFSGFSSSSAKTLSEAAKPRCKCSATPVSRFRGEVSNSMAARKNESADCRRIRLRLLGCVVDHHRHCHCREQLDDWHVARSRSGLLHAETAQPFAVEGCAFTWAAGNFHDLVALDRLLQDLGDVAHCILGLAAHVAQSDIEIAHHHRDRRNHDQGQQCQLPVRV